MKNLLFIFSLTLFFQSCSDDSIIIDTVEGSHLTIGELRDYIPNNYFEEKSMVFFNESGEEWKLYSSAIESTKDRVHEGENYKIDKFEITLFDPDNLSFRIMIVGSTNYATDQEGEVAIAKGINGMLMPFNESGNTWARISFRNGKPTMDFGEDFRESVTLNEKEFNEVFITIGKKGFEPHDAYSELDINSEFGVVAFRDENNDLWVFDRFED
jgi:hypothetical protein